MSVELLVSVASVLLSLAVAYIPGLKEKYESLDSVAKARVMAVALIAVAVGAFALACLNAASLFGLPLTCTAKDGVELVQILIAALVANQSAYMLLVRPFKK